MKKIAVALAFAASTFAMPAFAATFIVDANSVPSTSGTSLGFVIAGQSYRITATGIVDLVGGVIPNGPFNVDPNGKPTSPVAPPYGAFNPSGATITYDGYTPPLASANFGSLIGSLGQNGSLFLIGSSLTTSFNSSGELFALVNDINANNSGSFTVTVTPVPEPATWAMMLAGFGMIGFGLRSRRKQAVRVTYA